MAQLNLDAARATEKIVVFVQDLTVLRQKHGLPLRSIGRTQK
jgi:hypothetical protein